MFPRINIRFMSQADFHSWLFDEKREREREETTLGQNKVGKDTRDSFSSNSSFTDWCSEPALKVYECVAGKTRFKGNIYIRFSLTIYDRPGSIRAFKRKPTREKLLKTVATQFMPKP